jgi:chloramphenicol O-acetyltransferase type A
VAAFQRHHPRGVLRRRGGARLTWGKLKNGIIPVAGNSITPLSTACTPAAFCPVEEGFAEPETLWQTP